MALTPRQLNRATLHRQMLLSRERIPIGDAVRRLVGLQAQHPASPYLALWNRVAGFDPAELDAAVAGRTVVKGSLMRITLHAVHAEDYPVFRHAMEPTLRASRLNDRRFRASGLTHDDVVRLIPGLLEAAAEPRTAAELEAWVGSQLDPAHPGVWWALRTYAPLLRAPTDEPWLFGHRTAYVAPPVPPTIDEATADGPLRELVRRYLAAFGPASVADVAQFLLIPRGRARAVITAMKEELIDLEGPAGVRLVDLPGGSYPDAPAEPRLLPMWDNVLLAYHDRGRVVPPQYRTAVTRSNSDVLPAMLVDGYVAGVWRPLDGHIEATAFHRLEPGAWDALAREAEVLLALVAEREPRVYRRYDRWWQDLPVAQTRLLP